MDKEPVKTAYAVGYCRVSTDEQAKDGLSLDYQEQSCRDAIAKDGLECLKIIRDEGKSGKNMKRDGIQEIISMVTNKQVKFVYTLGSDRLNRNVLDYLTFRDMVLKANGVGLRFINQANMDDSATSMVTDTFLATVNEMHSRVTREKVLKTMHAKAEAGYYPRASPVGYLNAENPDPSAPRIAKRIHIVDPVAAPLVTEAFKLFASGSYTGYQLADLMYEKGLRSKPGKKFSYSKFYAVLQNTFYIGKYKWGKTICEKAMHPPLIDVDTFNKVQQVLAGNNHHACRRRKYSWLLNGFIYCHKHQLRYTAEWHLEVKKSYYHCTNKSGCGKYIATEVLEQKVAEQFQNIEFNPEFVERVITKVKAIFYQRREEYLSKKQALINQKTALEAKLIAAEEKMLEGVLLTDDFTRIRDGLKEEINNADSRISDLDRKQTLKVDVAREVLSFTQNIYQAYIAASPDLKRHYLAFFFERFEVQDGVIIKFDLGPLFDSLLKLEQASLKSKTPQLQGVSEVIIDSTWSG